MGLLVGTLLARLATELACLAAERDHGACIVHEIMDRLLAAPIAEVIDMMEQRRRPQ